MNIVVLGKNIQKIRKLNHMTQQELADKIGINLQNLSRIERGINFPRFQTVEKIANILGATANELLEEEFERNHLIEKELVQFYRKEKLEIKVKSKKEDDSKSEEVRLKEYINSYVNAEKNTVEDLKQIKDMIYFIKEKKIISKYE